ncbi:MAG: hypothetical protein PHT07_24045 [Paludibacter sp.]|nr:hypothetical protein [Paludibacter sp.]
MGQVLSRGWIVGDWGIEGNAGGVYTLNSGQGERAKGMNSLI